MDFGSLCRWPRLSRRAKYGLVAGSTLMLASFAGAIASLGEQYAAQPMTNGAVLTVELPLPSLAAQVDVIESESQAHEYISEEAVRPGDSLGSLLDRLGLGEDAAAARFLRADDLGKRVMQVRNGRTVTAKVDGEGNLIWLRFPIAGDAAISSRKNAPRARRGKGEPADKPAMPEPKADERMVVVEARNGEFTAREEAVTFERRIEMRAGSIRNTLFAATDAAGLPDAVTKQLADIFNDDIDFRSDLRRGDSFRVVYEAMYANGEYRQAGRVLAAQFVNAGKTYEAAWYEGEAGRGSYYGFDGKSRQAAFLRAPLEFSRVTSGFSMNRLHPILNTWRAHRGVDYGAATGTPVRAVGDAVVETAGWQNGYGNVVILKHQGAVSTVYGHLSGFAPGVRNGSRVGQGDIIGYVGSTGWATGPHLHYEFRVNGEQRDPLTVALPQSTPLDGRQRIAFQARVMDYQKRLALLADNAPAQVASNVRARMR
ncbi:M23 family metallopeptidase [Derxia gummosa]|uniref:M23 family metallopeptidase n=1 Tax=Derxia gummosa DSM 723 TaxID=1121388 RepID=A0A8B6X8Y4_9BURK|nr:M23 family metallopeptidase [Derxia gummosa]